MTQDSAIDALWPDLDPDAARNALYKAIHGLRRTLEPDLASARDSRFIQTRGGIVSLVPESIAWHDIDAFEHSIATASATASPDEARHLLRRALTLYRGDFADDDRYSDWPIPRREALRQARYRATLTLARLDLEAGSASQAIPFLDAVIAHDPDAEDMYRALMTAHVATGQHDLALREFERCRQALTTYLGTSPSPETTALAGRIRATVSQREAEPQRHVQPGAFNNLPALPTPTVGRATEIDHIYDLVHHSDARLVTVLGPGGVGKTRLAIEAGADLAARFADGVAFVALASIRDPDRLFDTLGRTLSLEPDPRRSMDAVVLEALATREQLLILDNFEQIMDAAGAVATLLETCRNVRVLVTSREPLRIRAEKIFRLDPLEVPSAEETPSPRNLAGSDSVALFLQSVRAHTPAFDLTQSNAPAVAGVCVRLEGLPLAIEIAAARCLDVPLETILTQLDHRMNALQDGPRDLPNRHRTLRDTISWSYNLLSPAEAALFRRLGVFAGGVEMDALLAIGGDGAEVHANTLVDKCLATWVMVDGVQRLGMLETIREFAVEELDAAGDLTEGQVDHAGFFAHLATQLEPELRLAGRLGLHQRLRRDLPNLREAIRFLIASSNSTAAFRVTAGTGPFWFARGLAREGREWMSAALALDGGDGSGDVAATCFWAGQCADYLAETAEARDLLERAGNIWSALGDEERAGSASAFRAVLLFREGKYAEALELHQEARRSLDPATSPWACALNLAFLARTISTLGDDPGGIAVMTEALAVSEGIEEGTQALIRLYTAQLLFDIEDPAVVLMHIERAERLARLVGDSRQIALSRYTGARLHEILEEPEPAIDALREAIALFDASHDRRGGALARLVLARIELGLEADTGTIRNIETAVRELRSAGDVSNLLAIQHVSAMMANQLGDHETAATLLGAGRHLVTSRDAVMARVYDRAFQRAEQIAATRLDPVTLEEARKRGATLDHPAQMDMALGLCERAYRSLAHLHPG